MCAMGQFTSPSLVSPSLVLSTNGNGGRGAGLAIGGWRLAVLGMLRSLSAAKLGAKMFVYRTTNANGVGVGVGVRVSGMLHHDIHLYSPSRDHRSSIRNPESPGTAPQDTLHAKAGCTCVKGCETRRTRLQQL